MKVIEHAMGTKLMYNIFLEDMSVVFMVVS